MKKFKGRDAAILLIIHLIFVILTWQLISDSLRERWQELNANPYRVAANIITGCIVGQGVFWIWGSDQIGLFMKPLIKFGKGEKIGTKVYEALPKTRTVAWTLKLLEILSDEARSQAEIWLNRRLGFGPDALAVGLTPALWHSFEVPEKIAGVIRRPEEVITREGAILSAQNTYGNLFRLVQVGVLTVIGDLVSRRLRDRIEAGLRLGVTKYTSR